MLQCSRKSLTKSYLGALFFFSLQIVGFCEEAKPEPIDPKQDPKVAQTYFAQAVEGFIQALERKEPQKFFEEAWTLADRANKKRFGDKLPDDLSKAFGSREVSQKQKAKSAQMWGALEKTVDLDRTFEGYRENRFSELGFTVEGLRGSMRMSKGFILAIEKKIADGLSGENRGKYSYLAFKHDMTKEFGFGENQQPKTPVHQVARAGTRSRLSKELVAKLGDEKAAKFEKAFGLFFVDVAGAAIFAHAEASMELARADAAKNSSKAGK